MSEEINISPSITDAVTNIYNLKIEMNNLKNMAGSINLNNSFSQAIINSFSSFKRLRSEVQVTDKKVKNLDFNSSFNNITKNASSNVKNLNTELKQTHENVSALSMNSFISSIKSALSNLKGVTAEAGNIKETSNSLNVDSLTNSTIQAIENMKNLNKELNNSKEILEKLQINTSLTGNMKNTETNVSKLKNEATEAGKKLKELTVTNKTSSSIDESSKKMSKFKEEVEEAKKKLESIKNIKIQQRIEIKQEIKVFKDQQLDNLKNGVSKALVNLKNSKIIVTVKAKVSEFSETINKILNETGNIIKNSKFTVFIKATNKEVLDCLNRTITRVKNSDFVLGLKLITSEFSENLKLVKTQFDKLKESALITFKINVDKLTTTLTSINKFTKKSFMVTLALKDIAKDKVLKLAGQINNLVSKPKKIIINAVTRIKSSEKLKNLIKVPRKIVVNAVARTSAASKKILTLSNQAVNLAKRPIKFIADLKNRASGKFNSLKGNLSAFGSKVFSPVVKIVDKTKAAFNKIKGRIGMIASMASSIVIGSAKAVYDNAVAPALDTEKEQIAVRQIFKNSGLQGNDLKNATDQYMLDMQRNNNKGTFETNDVLAAGRKALQMTGGDTGEAKAMLEMAQNMAAVNPDKSLADALQALKNLKSGNLSGMTTFNAGISEADFIKASGKNVTSMSQLSGADKTAAYKKLMSGSMQTKYEGGADTAADSTGGQIKVIKNNIGNILSGIGGGLLPLISSVLKPLADWFKNNQKTVEAFVKKITDGIGKVTNMINRNMPMIKSIVRGTVGAIKKAIKLMEPVFKLASKNIKRQLSALVPFIEPVKKAIRFLGEAWCSIWPLIARVSETAWNILKPIFSILASVASIIVDIFRLCWPVIKEVIEEVWNFIEPILNFMGKALEKVSKFAGWVADKIGSLVGKDKAIDDLGNKAQSKTTQESSTYSGKSNSLAVGISHVPYDNYPALLHEGERVLTKQEVNSSRAFGSISIAKLADSIVVREEADIDKISNKLVYKLQNAGFNMA